MRESQVDALLTAVGSGAVDFDGLRAERTPDGYAIATPEGTRSALTESAFRVAADRFEEYVTNWYFWTRSVGFVESGRNGEVDPNGDAGGESTGDESGESLRAVDAAGPHYRAFRRWLECAPTPTTPEDEETLAVPARYDALRDGLVREWGELRIETTVDDDGARRYDLRHVADADADVAHLARFDDPLAARDIGRTDARGRYRPLRTAPTLDAGWAFPALDAGGLVEAVEAFYPATVVNWHRERAGYLDVGHWRETAERQTGIYDVVDELPDDAVEWVAEACCVDSQCLKRREWHLDGETPLSADGGDGVFPCREPCSLVIAAARKWTTLEREEPRRYTVELTASELDQLEAIVNAVADSRIDEIREADVSDGANRYRARYLRAKRFEDGGFADVRESSLVGSDTGADDGAADDGAADDGAADDGAADNEATDDEATDDEATDDGAPRLRE